MASLQLKFLLQNIIKLKLYNLRYICTRLRRRRWSLADTDECRPDYERWLHIRHDQYIVSRDRRSRPSNTRRWSHPEYTARVASDRTVLTSWGSRDHVEDGDTTRWTIRANRSRVRWSHRLVTEHWIDVIMIKIQLHSVLKNQHVVGK